MDAVPPGLRIADVTFRYGDRLALDAVSFEVVQGRFCALLGPNGAGKSTLFALLTGLLATRAGRISVLGHDVARQRARALGRLGVVFQTPTLDLDISVAANLRYAAALHGLSGRRREDRIAAMLDRLGLADRAGDKVRALNGGHRRRAEIARALLHEPAVLLLDEPTVGLDPATRAGITDHVHALAAQEGLTVLWATHLTDEVRPDDDLVILHRGRVLRHASAGAVARGAPLERVFLDLTAEAA
ncbi:ABC transporter ATP-binding protein [Rubellimicrobium sp. CFH 75288]|uniref:ABC transporter ATP-binding protein n=1 Tax=Rubellimicrobium sp. CFH 75288 TaxID=2697034 RepID=UPI00141318A2|nr:ABC transporter ATP-binding protein [Rubellimicrobium sp. CFH 75288]NAZ36998.1 ATP-binding cassette domain-containing protein [Rubellimicrobium sp. CFH 75288]